MIGRRATLALVFSASTILFSLMTVALQVKAVGLDYLLGGWQLERHRAVLEGTSIDPWQYRVLSEYLVQGFIWLVQRLHVPYPIPTAFIAFRVLQNIVLLLLAAAYYRKLGLSHYLVLLGLSLLSWGISYGYHDADLQFNTYSDVIFYLLAALVILHGRIAWVVPIAGLAALNRETSLLIPFMILADQVARPPRPRARMSFLVAGGALGLSTVVLIALRLAYGARPSGMTHRIGFDLLYQNLARPQSWLYLFATLGLLPIMALVSAPAWPRALRANLWAIVPVWFTIHLFAAVIAETRLFLVPHALVFVPGALFGITYWNARDTALS